MKRCCVFAVIALLLWMLGTALASAEDGLWRYWDNDDGITLIGYNGNNSKVTIPDEIDGKPVTGIHQTFFSDEIKSITLPDSVSDLYYGTGKALEEIVASETNPTYMSIDGVLFSKDGTQLLAYPRGSKRTSYTVPEGVTEIGAEAFINNRNLKKIVLPSTLLSIGEYAFWQCAEMTDVEIQSGMLSIDEYAFYNCSKLANITLPDGLTRVGENAFTSSGITELIIPDSVTEIGAAAFSYCQQLQKVVLPEGFTSISDELFRSCGSLSEINIPDSVNSIGNAAFVGCDGVPFIISEDHPYFVVRDDLLLSRDGTQLLFAPQIFGERYMLTVPEGVTTIGADLCAYYKNLILVHLPDSVTSIGRGAFMETQLMMVVIPAGVQTIQAETFRSTFVRSVNLPDGLTTIEEYAFAYLWDLADLTIPESVTYIDEKAFYNVHNLTLHVTPGSYAETYAQENGLTYVTE